MHDIAQEAGGKEIHVRYSITIEFGIYLILMRKKTLLRRLRSVHVFVWQEGRMCTHAHAGKKLDIFKDIDFE